VFLRDPYQLASYSVPEAELYYFVSDDLNELNVGQEVLICGNITEATNYYDATTVDVYAPVVNPIPFDISAKAEQIPSDLLVEYENHGCGGGYVCPDYKVTIEASGAITYEGYNESTLVAGVQHAQVSQDKLRQLVSILQRSQFFSIQELPERIEGDPAGSILLRVKMGGQSKTVVSPWRGGPWPANVVLIQGKIEEISGLELWVNLIR